MDIRIYRRILSALLTFFVVCLLFSGCASKQHDSISSENQLPEWVVNPSKNGVTGGVGYCAAHIKGYTGQKELATQRALEEIARQKGVLVNSVMLVSSKASNQAKIPDTTTQNVSTFQTEQNVKAYIKEIWIHPTSKEMYIYMIAE